MGYITPLLPFIEQQPLYDQVIAFTQENHRPWTPRPGMTDQMVPYRTAVPALLCPSDGNKDLPENYIKATSYRGNRGDIIMDSHWDEWRGVYGNGVMGKCTFGTLTDGSSNTIMLAECPIGVNGGSMCPVKGGLAMGSWLESRFQSHGLFGASGTQQHPDRSLQKRQCRTGWGMGRRWGDSLSLYTTFFTIIGPNGPTCSGNDGESWDIPTAGSHHPTGCHVALCDGSVRFVTENIDTGDPNQIPPDMNGRPQDYSGPSLWGVWGPWEPPVAMRNQPNFSRAIVNMFV